MGDGLDHCLNCDTTMKVTSSFYLYFPSSQFISFYFELLYIFEFPLLIQPSQNVLVAMPFAIYLTLDLTLGHLAGNEICPP